MRLFRELVEEDPRWERRMMDWAIIAVSSVQFNVNTGMHDVGITLQGPWRLEGAERVELRFTALGLRFLSMSGALTFSDLDKPPEGCLLVWGGVEVEVEVEG